MNEIIKISINKGVLNNLEALDSLRNVSMDEQFEQTFTLFLGFYTLTKKERVEVMESISKAYKGNFNAT